ncbi:MAG: tetraacyldisaccharide 4'-kinase [Candidatus Omnitrophota bacterium]
MLKIREWYINFIEKGEKNIPENAIYIFLLLLSFVYGAIVAFRNFLYTTGIFHTYKCAEKVISIGNISWGGSGKTTLSFFLFQKLSPEYKVAVLRRGYGADEGKIFEEKNIQVFSSPNRIELTKRLASKFDLFILDDGFQYRKLRRDINILIMGARELKMKTRLIPAGIFREQFSALKRADILIINHKEELDNIDEIINGLKSKFKHLSVYAASYKFKEIRDLKNNLIDIGLLKGKKLAALAGIGYPGGFFNKLKRLGIEVSKKITYPDHYDLTGTEFISLQESLIKENMQGVLITGKDKYHLPKADLKIDFYVMEIEIEIAEEKKLLNDITTRLG